MLQRIHGKERDRLEDILHEHDTYPCACEVCTCSLHPCPIRKVPCKYPRPAKTIYQQSFIPHELDTPADSYNANKLPKVGPKHPLDKDTRYKVPSPFHSQLDYVEHPLEDKPVKDFSRRPREAVPFNGNTDYRKNYVDWGIPSIPPAVTVNTIPKVPFEGLSNYKEHFIPHDPNNRAKPLPRV